MSTPSGKDARRGLVAGATAGETAVAGVLGAEDGEGDDTDGGDDLLHAAAKASDPPAPSVVARKCRRESCFPWSLTRQASPASVDSVNARGGLALTCGGSNGQAHARRPLLQRGRAPRGGRVPTLRS